MGRNLIVDMNAEKTQIISFDWSNNSEAFDMKIDGSVLQKKSSFKILGLSYFSKLDCSYGVVFIAKTVSEKIEA